MMASSRLTSPTLRLVVLTGMAQLISGLCVVYFTHLARDQYAELQSLEATRWQLQETHSRLLLEHSTLASPHLVYSKATDSLGMSVPAAGQRRGVLL